MVKLTEKQEIRERNSKGERDKVNAETKKQTA